MKNLFQKIVLVFLIAFTNYVSASDLMREMTPRYWIEWTFGRSLKTSTPIICVDQKENGYKLFRMGAPSKRGARRIKEQGIKKIIVLSGDSAIFERKHFNKNECPEIVIEENQSSKVPLTDEFLDRFDAEIAKAKKNGEAIAIRCQIGCHRTGRLAFYYEVRYMGRSFDEARANYIKNGFMNRILHRYILNEQLPALYQKALDS